jgi:hypothetical protein
MAAVITSLYRAYCYARLLEMRGRRRHAGPGKGSSGGSSVSPPEEVPGRAVGGYSNNLVRKLSLAPLGDDVA